MFRCLLPFRLLFGPVMPCSSACLVVSLLLPSASGMFLFLASPPLGEIDPLPLLAFLRTSLLCGRVALSPRIRSFAYPRPFLLPLVWNLRSGLASYPYTSPFFRRALFSRPLSFGSDEVSSLRSPYSPFVTPPTLFGLGFPVLMPHVVQPFHTLVGIIPPIAWGPPLCPNLLDIRPLPSCSPTLVLKVP